MSLLREVCFPPQSRIPLSIVGELCKTLMVQCRVWLALEYKRISYDTMFINLRDKPKWFLDLIPENPKGLVPVAKIRNRLVHESFDILKVSFFYR